MKEGFVKKKIVKEISEETKVSEKTVESIFDKIFLKIKQLLINKKKVSFTNFGVFFTKVHPAGKRLDIKAFKWVKHKAQYVIKFRPSVKLTKQVRKGSEK